MSERIFKMTNDGIFINKTESIPFSNTNLPVDSIVFVGEIYWRVKVEMEILNGQSRIKVSVVDYNSKNYDVFINQKLQATVPFLVFMPFKYENIIKQLASLTTRVMRSICEDHPAGSKNLIGTNANPSAFGSYFSSESIANRKKQPEIIFGGEKNILSVPQASRKINLAFKQKIAETIFKNGFLEFTFYSKELNTDLFLTITNEFLKEEYDLLKDYISNRLGKKTFSGSLAIVIDNNLPHIESATSEDVAKIDKSFIDQIRIKQIMSLTKIADSKMHEKLLPVDEIFKYAENITNNIFNNDINDIIRVLTYDYQHRNSPQLRYLAKSHNFSLEKVYLTLKPHFGFVFYIKTVTTHHFIWELLDTHATYVWSFPIANFEQAGCFELMETAINEVHQNGRNPYKTGFKADAANIGFQFVPIEHQSVENEGGDSFEQWKLNIEAVILH